MKNMRFGRFMGLIFLFCGLIFAALGIAMTYETGSVFSFFLASPTLILLGLAMILFPGAKITFGEVNGDTSFKEMLRDRKKRDERQARQIQALGKAPLLHKIAWGVSFAVGIGLTLYVFIKLMF